MIDLNFLNEHTRRMLLALMLAASASAAMATLGQAPTTPRALSTAAPAPGDGTLPAMPSARADLYTVYEAALENGTSIREYATPAGRVFAVAWRGPVLPDLSTLLGSYFKIFKTETDLAHIRGSRGSPVSMERDGLVVRSNGRMRNFFGHAYAPELVPTGVNIKDALQ